MFLNEITTAIHLRGGVKFPTGGVEAYASQPASL